MTDDVERLLEDALAGLDGDDPGDTASLLASGDDTAAKRSVRDVLVDLARSCYMPGRTEDERPYLVPLDGANVALFAGAAKADLARRHLALHGRSVGRSPLDEAWLVVEAEARDIVKTPLPLRVASNSSGAVVDLADTAGRAVVIEAAGWRLVERSPVTFRRSKAMLALPSPERGGALADLLALVNVVEADRDLFCAWLAATLVEALPHPMVVLRGEQGSGKSSASRLICRIIDPCVAATSKPPRRDDEWSMACAARWLVAIDNVSHVTDWWSDALCRAVTGDGWLRRQLYTDESVAATAWRRCVVLNGASLGATLRPDLAERLVVFDLERPELWLTEAELDAAADDLRPGVLGALCDAAAATMAATPRLAPVRDLRMADFARFAAGYDAAHGTAALDAYRAKVGDIFDEALAADCLAGAVLALMDGRAEWQGTTTELLAALEPHRPTSDTDKRSEDVAWPTSAHHLSGQMTRSAAMLRRAGIVWHRPTRGNRRRLARLERLAEQSVSPCRPGAPQLPLVVPGTDTPADETQRGAIVGDVGDEPHIDEWDRF